MDHGIMDTKVVSGIPVTYWNPRRPINLRSRHLFGQLRSLPGMPRLSNFGDLLEPIAVKGMVTELNFRPPSSPFSKPLFAIGSIIHFCKPESAVWGAGVNGHAIDAPLPSGLDVRATRGPETRAYLEDRGMLVPDVCGDPALLLPRFLSASAMIRSQRRAMTLFPNLNEPGVFGDRGEMVRPDPPLMMIISEIVSSDLVIATSLYAVIVAEAYGIRARVVRSSVEPDFKYEDYYIMAPFRYRQIIEDGLDAVRDRLDEEYLSEVSMRLRIFSLRHLDWRHRLRRIFEIAGIEMSIISSDLRQLEKVCQQVESEGTGGEN